MNGLPRWLPFAIAAGVLAYGWHELSFLCDDAFIAFRYVGNAHDGHGLCWNPPPFVPVEGYSCFLWVMLLWGVWEITGAAPPQSANWLALCFALGTLALVARELERAAPPSRPGWRVSLATLVLLGCATSPLFVTWASSGLETAMFGFFAVAWTFAAFRDRSLALTATLAGLALLARPDGGLLVLATAALALHAWALRRRPLRSALGALWPLLVPAAHLGWRRWYYGEWVPNTYFAKVTAAWPESGLRYLWCFVLEHGVLPWLGVALVWGVVVGLRAGALRRLFTARFGGLVTVVTWLLFVGYYALVVGGDHFGFRPFAHLVPLLFAALFGMLVALRARPALALPLVLVIGFAANAVGWSLDVAMRKSPTDGFVRAHAVLPAALVPFARTWEAQRAWLRLHYVALPRPLHAATCAGLRDLLPERRAGQVEGLAPGVRGVYRTVAAGVVAWALPDVAILDAVGLNDRVIARNPVPPAPLSVEPAALAGAFAMFDGDRDARLSAVELAGLAERLDLAGVTGVVVSASAWTELLLALCDGDDDGGLGAAEFGLAVAELQDTRHMAHERAPPVGYVEALRPNVELADGRFVVRPGVAPLTDAEVRQVEREYWQRVGR